MFFEIYTTESFIEDYDKLTKIEQRRIDKIKEQLKTNPYAGKPLGYEFFREKRLNGKRLYYLIFQDVVVVLLVAYSDKKSQQATIDAIRRTIDVYRKDIYDRFKKNTLIKFLYSAGFYVFHAFDKLD
ncbi:MAG: hypothetical protein J4400_01550 [Candidatus Aenigmarchaeota archaeon]|nr:hypothetical protein [Candidatus Aenigmarchaeota archaeon]